MATHSSILACKMPWTEEPGGVQSMGSRRVAYSLAMFETMFENWAICLHGLQLASLLISCFQEQDIVMCPPYSQVVWGFKYLLFLHQTVFFWWDSSWWSWRK